MASRTLCRAALQRNAFPLGVGLTSGLVLLHHQPPLRLDSVATAPPVPRRQFSDRPKRKDHLNPEVLKQLSSGSLSGFLAGLLVSVFSKTLVLIIGVGIVFIQVAARYGIDLVGPLKLKKRVESSRILTALRYNPTFKIAFGVTFALSAFMSF
ncbi:hypothetical protein B0T16DRAFT_148305 [Cercophora newfieldiana]|uniref:Fun14 family protein n=1 Tax=Cercophora newfieldiana TaxID=92897 RepID=A0AA40CQV1_9PEZI|nr:hypothetical protein B0T16DRAFT_148305 [Cercophora newfieldiana]